MKDSQSEAEIEWLKSLLATERRRHGNVEGILTRHIERLEKQVSDLQELFVQTVAEKLTVNGTGEKHKS